MAWDKNTSTAAPVELQVSLRGVFPLLLAAALGVSLGLGGGTQLVWDVGYSLADSFNGYTLDRENNCVVEQVGSSSPSCRALVPCAACAMVRQIDVWDVSVRELHYETFERIYSRSGRPLVVRNATRDWQAAQVWSFEFFSDLYRRLDSPVLTGNGKGCQFFSWDFSEFSNLGQVFAMAPDRASMAKDYSPWYVGWSNCDEEAEEELGKYFSSPSFFHPETRLGARTWFFLGTPGWGAPSHLDQVLLPSWQAQVRGRKWWGLSPPPECWWQCRRTGMLEVVLEPGDILVVNTNWWYHQTKVLPGDLSITVTSEFD